MVLPSINQHTTVHYSSCENTWQGTMARIKTHNILHSLQTHNIYHTVVLVKPMGDVWDATCRWQQTT